MNKKDRADVAWHERQDYLEKQARLNVLKLLKESIITKLNNATPATKELGGGVVEWDNVTYNLQLAGQELEILRTWLTQIPGDVPYHLTAEGYKAMVERAKMAF